MSHFNKLFDELVDIAIDECIVYVCEELKEILDRRREWVKRWVSRRDRLGASSTLFREMATENPLDFKRHLRMSVENFEELLEKIERFIVKQDTAMRLAIPARAKLQVTLRFLASGDSLQSLALLFRIAPSTISEFLPHVLRAIIKTLKIYIQVPQTTTAWQAIQRNFDIKWNFPSCCGAIDGKHISIKRPAGSCSEFFNYKGGYSITLLALVDAECRFLYIDVGTNGRANDGCVFRLSSLKAGMDNNNLNMPNDYVIIGDDAFPLRTDLLKPYSKRNLTLTERIYNYRLSRARRVVENAFGILASRFRVFGRPIDFDLSTVDLIVQCACTIHNWLRTTSPSTYFEKGSIDYEDTETAIIYPGDWRSTNTELPSIDNQRSSNNCTKRASDKRARFAEYFMGAGSVPWQMKSIGAE